MTDERERWALILGASSGMGARRSIATGWPTADANRAAEKPP